MGTEREMTVPKSKRLAARIAEVARATRPRDDANPLWAGPGGAGPNGGVTQGMVGRFLSCRERFRLKYICGLEPPPKWSHRLGYGNMWHVCEEAHARGSDWAAAHMEHTHEMLRLHPLQREEITKWFQVCAVQFPEYIQYWREHPDVLNREPLFQEQVFDVPYLLPSGRTVRLRGKWDSVDLITDDVTGPQGGVYLQENKTKGDVDKLAIERQLRFDLQTMLYLVALRVGKERYPGTPAQDWPILGVRYNVVRRPLSGGRGTIRPHAAKATKRTYTPAETDEQFYERLRRDYLAAEPDYWFFRLRVEVSHHDVEVFRATCLDPILEQMCWWYDEVTDGDLFRAVESYGYPPLSYRMPFGVYSPLDEAGSTEYDAYLETRSEAGLRRTEVVFPELQ